MLVAVKAKGGGVTAMAVFRSKPRLFKPLCGGTKSEILLVGKAVLACFGTV